MRHFLLPLVLVACSLTGCARYEYAVVGPQEAAGHVGRKADHIFARDPLEYRLLTADNRLVMRIFNPTDDAIALLGGQSSAVDPQGQSHPLRTLTIAPHSFAKLIFPPPRPRFYGGPSIGFGVGTYVGHADHAGYYHYDDWYDEPYYLTVYDDSDALYWDWEGEGEARLNLVFERDKQTFAHDFVIRRLKV